ncbi:MAG: efflux RND transporter periplasmic adaptor subunit, partial [Alphaproteobacteria bacterium]|nr:efflux RND transporter periplasmic adaptor subunit [Alphaproteobacteria bacterium]
YGTIVKLNMEETYPTNKGAQLAQLDIQDRGAQIKRAKALLQQREIEFEAANKLAQKGFNSLIKKSESEANLEAAKTELRMAEINYSHTSIKSPFDGIVQEQHVEIGDYVKDGDPIATIVDMNPIYIVAYVSEKEINAVSQGSTASATLITGEKVEGIVSHISPIALEATRSFEVKVEVPNDAGTILSGITASVHLPLGNGKAHKLSPALLTLNDEGQVGVKTLDENNVVRFNVVKVIEDTENGVWVSGLSDKAKIIAVGQEFVTDGTAVNATQIDQTPLSNSLSNS